MIKRNLFIIAMIAITFALTSNAFSQSNKRSSSSSGKINHAKKGVAEWTDILRRKPKSKTKNTRKAKKPNQVTGGTIPVYKGNQRKSATKSIVILDQDTQTIKTQRKRKRNK